MGERKAVRHGEEILLRVADPHRGPDADAERGEDGSRPPSRHRRTGGGPPRRGDTPRLEGLSYEEIAAALGIELGTVRSRLHRARTDLKDKMERFLP